VRFTSISETPAGASPDLRLIKQEEQAAAGLKTPAEISL
jgi:hypothetical protein